MPSSQPPPLPIVLDLAPLPREQIGPFFLLGVDKSAGKEEIEAAWAQRLIGARKNLIALPLEDINWAREMLTDPVRRARADAASLNADGADQALRRLQNQYEESAPNCPLLEADNKLDDYSPAVVLPDREEIVKGILPGEIPLELPVLELMLNRFLNEPLEPWGENLGIRETATPPAANQGNNP